MRGVNKINERPKSIDYEKEYYRISDINMELQSILIYNEETIDNLNIKLSKLLDIAIASSELLKFIRDKYPDDFLEDLGNFTCKYHKAIYNALEEYGKL